MIKYTHLNKNDLITYLKSDEFRDNKVIPITTHRANSQFKNPRLNEKDILLILAYEDDKLIGYAGILPDFIIDNNNQQHAFGWLSCLWTSPQKRGQGIGLQLINESLAAWNNRILSADYAPLTKKLYDKTNAFLTTPYTKKGLRLYIKSDLQNLLPPKHLFFEKSKGLLKLADSTINSILSIKSPKHKNLDVKLEHVTSINDELEQFIKKNDRDNLFKRQAVELNWMLQNPWIIRVGVDRDVIKRYHFSSVDQFDYQMVVARDNNSNILGLMIFSRRNWIIKLPYLIHNNCIEVMAEIVNKLIVDWDIKTLTTFHAELIQVLKIAETPALTTRIIERNYMISKSLQELMSTNPLQFQDGDGDCGFT